MFNHGGVPNGIYTFYRSWVGRVISSCVRRLAEAHRLAREWGLSSPRDYGQRRTFRFAAVAVLVTPRKPPLNSVLAVSAHFARL